jgi:hypothetical protein
MANQKPEGAGQFSPEQILRDFAEGRIAIGRDEHRFQVESKAHTEIAPIRMSNLQGRGLEQTLRSDAPESRSGPIASGQNAGDVVEMNPSSTSPGPGEQDCLRACSSEVEPLADQKPEVPWQFSPQHIQLDSAEGRIAIDWNEHRFQVGMKPLGEILVKSSAPESRGAPLASNQSIGKIPDLLDELKKRR